MKGIIKMKNLKIVLLSALTIINSLFYNNLLSMEQKKDLYNIIT
jgi:hypothetical protein